jgi:methylaspartate ammonia-lyase
VDAVAAAMAAVVGTAVAVAVTGAGERKAFFSEEKKQKTFTRLASASPEGASPHS